MRPAWVARTRWVLLIVSTGVLLCLGLGATKAPDPGRPSGLRQRMNAPLGQMGTNMRSLQIDYRQVEVALAQREQTDFLLTPALLVQEAVSDGIVLTYPQE